MRPRTRRAHVLVGSLVLAAPAAAQRIPAVTIVAAGTQTVPVVATTGALCYVAWSDYVHVGLRRSSDGGGTWSSGVGVDRSTSCRSNDLQVAVNGNDVFAVWTGSANCGPFGQVFDSRIRFNRSADAGSTWLPSDVLVSGTPITGFAYRPQIAIDGTHLFVVWEDDRDGPTNVYFTRSLDSGATWLPPVRLDTDPPAAAASVRPRIAASANTVCVTWMDYRNGLRNVYCNRSLDNGTTWLANDLRLNTGVAAGTKFVVNPEIVVDGLSVCVVWHDARHWTSVNVQDTDIYANRSLDGGTTWLPTDVRVGPGTAPGTITCMEAGVARSGSTVHVAWRDLRSTSWDVFAKRSLDGGATWQPTETRLNGGHAPGTAFAMLPAIAATPAVVTVAWQGQGVPGYVDLFSNRSIDGGITWLPAEVRLDTTAPGSSSSAFHTLAAAGDTVRAAWIEGPSVVTNLPFGFVRYGISMPGSGGYLPTLAGNGLPALGGTFTIDVGSGLGGTIGVLLVGDGPASRVSVPLLGGILLVNPFTTLTAVLGGTQPGTGAFSLALAVPVNAALVGLDLNFQALLVDPASLSGFVWTNAVEAWID